MTDYNLLTEDDKSRQIHPILFNTAKDGSGTWYFGLVNSEGKLIINLPANSGVDIGDVDILSIAAGTNAIGKVGHDTTSLGDGRKVVATAASAEALASSTPCKWVLITAETDNTGVIVVGASTVVASLATRRGTPLFAGESVLILTDNLADIFLDTTVNGDGVTFSYGV